VLGDGPAHLQASPCWHRKLNRLACTDSHRGWATVNVAGHMQAWLLAVGQCGSLCGRAI